MNFPQETVMSVFPKSVLDPAVSGRPALFLTKFMYRAQEKTCHCGQLRLLGLNYKKTSEITDTSCLK